MKVVLTGVVVALFFSGCGDGPEMELGQNSTFFGEDSTVLLDAPTTCNESIFVAMKPMIFGSTLPGISFASTNTAAVKGEFLKGAVTHEQRCHEIQHYLSGTSTDLKGKINAGRIGLEMSFFPSDMDNEQMAQGKTVAMHPATAALEFLDAKRNGGRMGVGMHCTNPFPVTCERKDIDGHKECVSYRVEYQDSNCSFQIVSLPFSFSDGKLTQVNFSGELKLGKNNIELKISDVSVNGLY